jgi:hypothetical protein
MQAQVVARRVLKVSAALSAVLLIVSSFGAILIAASMDANPFDQVRWSIALVVVPIAATGSFICGSLKGQSSLRVAVSYYLLAVCMVPAWVFLTRG